MFGDCVDGPCPAFFMGYFNEFSIRLRVSLPRKRRSWFNSPTRRVGKQKISVGLFYKIILC